jgi:hypothetical protein
VGWNLDCAAFVIDLSLQPAMNTADGQHVRLVEVGDRFVVLALSVLDHKPVRCVVCIHRKGAPSAVAAWIAHQPIKAVLTTRGLTEDRVAKIDNVSLV